jgi:hypothetical protein
MMQWQLHELRVPIISAQQDQVLAVNAEDRLPGSTSWSAWSSAQRDGSTVSSLTLAYIGHAMGWWRVERSCLLSCWFLVVALLLDVDVAPQMDEMWAKGACGNGNFFGQRRPFLTVTLDLGEILFLIAVVYNHH